MFDMFDLVKQIFMCNKPKTKTQKLFMESNICPDVDED